MIALGSNQGGGRAYILHPRYPTAGSPASQKNLYLHMTSREKVFTHTHTHTHAHKPLTLSDIRRQKTNPPYPIFSNSDLSLFSLLSSLTHTHTTHTCFCSPTSPAVSGPRKELGLSPADPMLHIFFPTHLAISRNHSQAVKGS